MNSFALSATEQIVISPKFENEHMGSVLDQLVKLRCLGVYFAFNFFQVEVSGYYLSSVSGSVTGTASMFKKLCTECNY